MEILTECMWIQSSVAQYDISVVKSIISQFQAVVFKYCTCDKCGYE